MHWDSVATLLDNTAKPTRPQSCALARSSKRIEPTEKSLKGSSGEDVLAEMCLYLFLALPA